MTESSSFKDDFPPDPSPQIPIKDVINGRMVTTTTSLIFKNFKSPMIRIDAKRLFDVTGSALYDIVKGVVAEQGDGSVTPYSFEWHSGPTFLRLNHRIDDGMKYVCCQSDWLPWPHWTLDPRLSSFMFTRLCRDPPWLGKS